MHAKLSQLRRSEDGMAMMMVMVSTLVLALITVTLANLALSEYATATLFDRSMQAFFIADGAAERAVAVLRTDANWNDNADADQEADSTSWRPLRQAGVPLVNQSFPPSASPAAGTYSIFIRRPTLDEGLNATHNIWVRVLGRSRLAARTIEFRAHRLTPLNFMAYSAEAMVIDSGGGNVTIHGSAYFRGDLGLKAVKTGIYNDRPLKTTDSSPYDNQLFVRGELDMSTGNSTVGTSPQPMYGVHATRIDLKNDGRQNLWTDMLTNTVPDIAFPDISGYLADVLNRDTYGNRLSGDESQLVLCKRPVSGGAWVAETTPNLILDASYVRVIPRKTYLSCDGNVTDAGNHMLIWQPDINPSAPGTLILDSTYKDEPIFVPGVVAVGQTFYYQGVGSVVVQNRNNAAYGLDAGGGQMLSRYRASGTLCGEVNPTTMPATDLLGFIVAGSVLLKGDNAANCGQEQNVALVAGAGSTDVVTFTHKVQLYGMAVAKRLDTKNNPDFWQIPDLGVYLPLPMSLVMSFNQTMPVIVREWREILR